MKPIVDQLFFNRYWVKVEERAFHDKKELEEVGLMGVTSLEEANMVMSSFRNVRATIVELAYYFDKNVKIQFIDQNNITEIFDIIDKHLNNWLMICNRHGYIPRIPPIEDFELLDNLAEKLFPLVKRSSLLDKLKRQNVKFSISDKGGETSNGFYERYSPKLFNYCAMVHGEPE